MNNDAQCRLLTLADVEEAAHVISQAFQDDPLIAFMLPHKSIRVRTLGKFFRVCGEIKIKNGRGYGVGQPLQGVAYWEVPNQAPISIRTSTYVLQ